MGNRCLEKPSSRVMSDECNFKRNNDIIDTVLNAGECSPVENSTNSDNSALLNHSNAAKDRPETSNQIENGRLSIHPEVILRPIENSYPTEAKRLCLDKENDISVISIYPTMHSNFQNLLKYNAVYNGFGSFINSSKCLNINLNNQIPFIPVIYNANIQQSNIPSYIRINDFIPNETIIINDTSTQQVVIANSQSCKESTDASTLHEQKNEEDDDVVFVKEYKIESFENQGVKTKRDGETNKVDLICSNRGRKRRGILVEKRKNPLRKAQMDKASIKLAENLSIPPAVFNARIPSKKSKQATNIQKVVRQSCRTTGAILSPPRPLNRKDFKEWPAKGLHEIPWYNEQTGAIEVFNRSCDSTRNEKSERKQSAPKNLSDKVFSQKRKTEQNKLSILAHNRLHLSLDYVKELKEFDNLTKDRNESEKEEKQDSLDNVGTILYDTCELYSLLNNTGLLSVAKYIESFNEESSSS